MRTREFNVLFLCTGNSARSIMAESILRRLGGGRFRAFSAGSRPQDAVHPLALEILREQGYPTEGLRAKSWAEFEAPGAPVLDWVITVCDNAAAEVCPVWPGQPLRAHWSIADPAKIGGSQSQRLAAFAQAFRVLQQRISALTALPIEQLDAVTLADRLQRIGRG